TAVFSVVSTLLLHPLPYPNANRLVYVNEEPASGNNTGVSVTISRGALVIRAWKENSKSFEALEPASISPLSLKPTSDEPSRVNAAMVLPSFPDFAGVRPIARRMFTTNDVVEGRRVVVLGEGFWRERMGAAQSALGQLITLNDTSYMIVGVMPSSLRFGSPGRTPTDVWLPFDLRNDKLAGSVIGRLRP